MRAEEGEPCKVAYDIKSNSGGSHRKDLKNPGEGVLFSLEAKV